MASKIKVCIEQQHTAMKGMSIARLVNWQLFLAIGLLNLSGSFYYQKLLPAMLVAVQTFHKFLTPPPLPLKGCLNHGAYDAFPAVEALSPDQI